MEIQIVVERPMRTDAEPLQHGMILLDSFDRTDHPINNLAQELNEGELILGVVDFAPEECDPSSIFLGVGEELERVPRRTGRAAEDADHEMRVEPDQFLQRLWSVINH